MIDSLLLVDDNPIDQKLYARLIQRSGLVSHYESCLSGPAALERLAKGPVDLMLLDVNMPGMSILQPPGPDGRNDFAAFLHRHRPGRSKSRQPVCEPDHLLARNRPFLTLFRTSALELLGVKPPLWHQSYQRIKIWQVKLLTKIGQARKP